MTCFSYIITRYEGYLEQFYSSSLTIFQFILANDVVVEQYIGPLPQLQYKQVTDNITILLLRIITRTQQQLWNYIHLSQHISEV